MIESYLGIDIDLARDALLPEQGKVLLTKKGFYKMNHETSPQHGFARAATSYCFGDYELAQRIYDAASLGYFTFASPVLSNAQEVNWPYMNEENDFEKLGLWLEQKVKPRGMPISCFLSYIPDTKEGLVNANTETRWLSMLGGGIGIYPSNRSPDAKSTGVMSHLRGYDADALSYKQTEARRGSIAAYMNIDHPEILTFIDMRNPVGGDSNTKCFNINNGVNITDDFMYKVIGGEKYELVDPKHGGTGRMLDAREVWEKLMEVRFETGEPYLLYIDTVNRNIPKQVRNPMYNIVQSNLCSEITLMTSEKRTAVCCLSSLNLEKYDEWKDIGLVGDLIRMLDNVLEYFIRLAPPELSRAVYSAKKERALGLGTLGWHSYLQSKSIPFESGGFNSAIQHTNLIYNNIKNQAETTSKCLGIERGESPDCRGSGFRNSHLMALAPNASSSQMINVSPSVEPWSANAFVSKGRAGLFLIKNKHLDKILTQYAADMNSNDYDEQWLADIWKDIIDKNGSVQHLNFLSEHDKKVFKTFTEIDQMWVIEQAEHRTPKICQSSSLNISVAKGVTLQEMSDIHMAAWWKGVKSLYYCRAEAAVQAKVSDGGIKAPLNAVAVETENKYEECRSCEG
jgi:ribonucleoside-diphosphate reductase alpha chain